MVPISTYRPIFKPVDFSGIQMGKQNKVAYFYVKLPPNTTIVWEGSYVGPSYDPPNPLVRIEVRPAKVKRE